MRRYNLHVLAELLGKMVCELDAMPHAEFVGWLAYLRLKTRLNK